MKHVIPACFSDFQCIADRCPDTCCAGWTVDLDDNTVKTYQHIPGKLGDALRSLMVEEDGSLCFRMGDRGRCPFLTEQNLCQLILSHGEILLSETCREHPRFYEDYGDLQETCLGISCPEAARLLFSKPFTLREQETDPPSAEPLDSFNQRVLDHLLEYRQGLFALTRCRRPLLEKMALIAATAEPEQRALEWLETLDAQEDRISTEAFREPRAQDDALEQYYETLSAPDWKPRLRAYLSQMTGMEFTRDDLKLLLNRVLAGSGEALLAPLTDPAAAPYGETLLQYFLYRYILRGLWNLELMDKVRFALYSLGAILALSAGMPGDTLPERITASAVLYCREVEHSDENLEMLWNWLWEQG